MKYKNTYRLKHQQNSIYTSKSMNTKNIKAVNEEIIEYVVHQLY